jgi:hypothetical protein
MTVPRYERIAAIIVGGAYGILVVWLWGTGANPLSLLWVPVRYAREIVSGVMRGILPSWDGLAFLVATLNGCAALTLILVVQALIRALGLRGFLGWRSSWWWTGAHAGATLIFSGAALSYDLLREVRMWPWVVYPGVVLLSACVLWRGRRQALSEGAP